MQTNFWYQYKATIPYASRPFFIRVPARPEICPFAERIRLQAAYPHFSIEAHVVVRTTIDGDKREETPSELNALLRQCFETWNNKTGTL